MPVISPAVISSVWVKLATAVVATVPVSSRSNLVLVLVLVVQSTQPPVRCV